MEAKAVLRNTSRPWILQHMEAKVVLRNLIQP